MRVLFTISFLALAFSTTHAKGGLRRKALSKDAPVAADLSDQAPSEDLHGDFFMAMEEVASVEANRDEENNEERALGYKCYNHYKCPAYSYRKPNRKCYDSFDDCQCYSGYYKYGHKCVKKQNHCYNNYKCPAYSYRKPNRKCYDSFDDCECKHGYVKYGKKCVKKTHCKNNYYCPAYSSRKPNRQCYDSFDDCSCWSGYYKHGNRCVRKRYGYLDGGSDGDAPETLGAALQPDSEDGEEDYDPTEEGEDEYDEDYEDYEDSEDVMDEEYYDEIKDEIEKVEEEEEAFEEELEEEEDVLDWSEVSP